MTSGRWFTETCVGVALTKSGVSPGYWKISLSATTSGPINLLVDGKAVQVATGIGTCALLLEQIAEVKQSIGWRSRKQADVTLSAYFIEEQLSAAEEYAKEALAEDTTTLTVKKGGA